MIQGHYVGRCSRCGMALWVLNGIPYGRSAGKPVFQCGIFRWHKVRIG